MKKKNFAFVALALLLVTLIALTVPAFADEAEKAAKPALSDTAVKAITAAAIVGVVATAGALGMAFTVGRATDGMARQPEAAGKINSSMMLGLVFIETAIIYALIVAIFIIFVLQ